MSHSVRILNGLDYLYPDNTLLSQAKNTLSKFPEIEDALADALSLGQIKSKLWLVDHLPSNLGTVFICAGWYGTLASLMFERANTKFEKIRSFDIDSKCARIADSMNKPYVMDAWRFKASTLDISVMDYPTNHTTFRADGSSLDLEEMPDTIINTSCEHIENFTDWYSKIPNGKIVVLQSNNYFEVAEHINCSDTLTSFESQTPMSEVIYSGELELTDYTRFMRIGIK